MRLSAFDTYCLYLSIKSHFTTDSYDYFKYGGKVTAKKETFEIRKDRFQFQRLSRKYSDEQMLDFLIANFAEGKHWVGDLLEDDANAKYLAYIKRKQSFTYIFTNEVNNLFEVDKPQDVFKSNNSYPRLIEFLLSRDIGYDTASVLNSFFDFVPKFDRDLGTNDIIWKNLRLSIIKLLPFIEYDRVKVKSIIKTAINI